MADEQSIQDPLPDVSEIQKSDLLEFITRLQREFIVEADPSISFDRMLEFLLKLTGSEYGFIGEVRRKAGGQPFLKTHAITNIAWSDETRSFYEQHAPAGLEFENLENLFGEVIKQGETVISNTPKSDSRSGGLPDGHPNLRAFLGLPFFHAEELIGMVGLANRSNGYDDSLVQVLEPALATCASMTYAARLEQRRRQAEESYRDLFENAHDLIQSVDPDGKFVYVNQSWLNTLGYQPDELEGMTIWDVVHADSLEHCQSLFREIMGGKPEAARHPVEVKFQTKDNRTITLEGNIGLRMEEGRVLHTRGIFRDVSARRQAEADVIRQGKLLRDSKERLQLAVEAANLGIWDWDLGTNAVVYSPEWRQQLGFGDEEHVGHVSDWEDLLHPDDLESTIQKLDAYLQHREGPHIVEFRLRHVDGSYRWIYSCGVAFDDEHGKPYRMLGCHMDITDRKLAEKAQEKLQTEVRHNQKMEAVGRLAAVVAHEFNNILLGVLANAEALLMIGDADRDTTKKILSQIKEAGERGAGLTKQLLAFSRKAPTEQQVFDLNLVVREVEPLVLPIIGENINLRLELCSESAFICGDRGQLEQAIVNLALNARDAMPHGGDLTIRTDHSAGDADLEDAAVHLTVRDTGSGMSREVVEQIFMPFFTTKQHGTGLGLSTAYGDIRKMGGSISVESQVGEGSVFNICFPARDRAPASDRQDQVSILRGRGETILVCDDDEISLGSVSALLQAYGYRVAACRGGAEALAEVDTGDAVSLLITDVAMPGMTGYELAEKVKQLKPDMPVLFTSGYGDDVVPDRIRQSARFLQKPATADELCGQVRELLDGRAE